MSWLLALAWVASGALGIWVAHSRWGIGHWWCPFRPARRNIEGWLWAIIAGPYFLGMMLLP